MDLKQKSIAVKKKKFEFDEWFIDELLEKPYEVGVSVMTLIQKNSHTLPEKTGWSQYIGGVIKNNPPFFFEIEYVKEHNKHPIYIDIIQIECDDYLDYINKKQTLK